jgi:hypothetical protein
MYILPFARVLRERHDDIEAQNTETTSIIIGKPNQNTNEKISDRIVIRSNRTEYID